MKLIKTMKTQEGFSESERMIADFLLANYRGLPSLSTRQLAKLTYTSSAAIVRFAQKMGFEGYTEFKIQFMAEMMQHVSQPQDDEGFNSKDTVRDIMKKVTNLEMNALKETHHILEPRAVIIALNLIVQSQHVDFYATDDNINIANLASASLIMADKTSTVTYSIPQLYLLSTSASPEHLSFFISRTGENRMLVDMAHAIKNRGGKILLLTSEPDSSLGRLADQVLTVASVKKLEELGPRIFLGAAKYVVDIIFATLVARKGLGDAHVKEKWLLNHFKY